MNNIEGTENIIKAIEGLYDSAKLTDALQKACAVVEAVAKEKAPKDTGALRRSITSKVEGDEGIVYTPLEYAPYIEYGTGLFSTEGGRINVPWNFQDDEGIWHKTSGQKPQPFLHPALKESREKIIKLIKEALKND